MSDTTVSAKNLFGGVSTASPRHRRALFFSLWDGIFANAMLALVETFGIAAAVYLDAPAIAIALLGSLPLLLSSFGQLLIPMFVNPASGRKKFVLRGTTMQSVFIMLVACSGYLPEGLRVWTYVLLFALYGFSGNVIAGFWIAWMGDLVPYTVRGRHFAWRNRIFSVTQLLCALIAGLISRRYSTATAHWLLFAIVFFSAGFFRLLSTVMLQKQYEPPIAASPIGRSFKLLFRQSRPFLFYCLAAALVQGSTSIAGPFFNVWYIRDLNFNYFTLSAAAAATILGTIVALPFWGRIADSFGNRTVIIITVFLIATVPLPYIASSRPWQIWLLNFYAGCCWSGYNLSNLNYLMLAAGKEKPEQNISFAVAVTGICNFLFSIIGGYLATRLPHLFHYRLHSLFLLSSIMRFVIFGLLIVRYPRYETPKRRALDLFFQLPGYRAVGLLRNSFRAFRSK
ncbi:MAG: MFS transporter [Chitinispirillaceae bacterium]|nr:MFS transporter [Chitinispirillaceae bacterium]